MAFKQVYELQNHSTAEVAKTPTRTSVIMQVIFLLYATISFVRQGLKLMKGKFLYITLFSIILCASHAPRRCLGINIVRSVVVLMGNVETILLHCCLKQQGISGNSVQDKHWMSRVVFSYSMQLTSVIRS